MLQEQKKHLSNVHSTLSHKVLAIFLVLTCVLLPLTSCESQDNLLHGYVEGEYLYIAPTTPGLLETLFVRRGQQVQKGDDLFALEDTDLLARIDSAEADVDHAQAQLDNLLKGLRPEEIEVIVKQREQAKAVLQDTQKQYERAKILIKSDITISQSEFDRRKALYESSKANLEALDAQLKVANLGARADEIEAARATLDMAKQRLIQAQKHLTDSAPKAPSDGYIEDTYYLAGEFVPEGRAVVSLLPPENIKVRFFVPQAQLPEVQHGKIVILLCDGCNESIAATITYISSQAEYTPPVIYSNESREKLVYMVEAIPTAPNPLLHPGLPVDVRMEGA